MNIQSQPPQHATPPESFSGAPMTPPPTDEKSTRPVSRIIREIRNQQEGRNLTSIPWASYKLDVKGYEDLLHRLQDESLRGFAQHKLRYREPNRILCYLTLRVWLTSAYCLQIRLFPL